MVGRVDILLIGGGIASATAAATLRDEGFDGSVLVVGRELDAPYHRPPATKGYLRGEDERAAVLVHPEGWWAEHDVELLTRTSVLALDAAAHTAKLSTKQEVAFDRALLATGAMVRRLDEVTPEQVRRVLEKYVHDVDFTLLGKVDGVDTKVLESF